MSETMTTAIPMELARLIAEAQARVASEEEAARRAQAARDEQAQEAAIGALRETLRECVGERLMALLGLEYSAWKVSDTSWNAGAETWLGDYHVRATIEKYAHLKWTAVRGGARFMATEALEIGADSTQEHNTEHLLRWLGRVFASAESQR